MAADYDHPFSLQNGWTWAAVLNLHVQDQRIPGEKVVYEIGPAIGGPKLTVGLDQNGNFQFAVTDTTGTKHATTVERSRLGERAVYVVCELAPLEGGRRWRASIWINSGAPTSVDFNANFDGQVRAQQGVGGDIFGNKNAAFSLAEMMMYGRPLTEDERAKLQAYVTSRYGELSK